MPVAPERAIRDYQTALLEKDISRGFAGFAREMRRTMGQFSGPLLPTMRPAIDATMFSQLNALFGSFPGDAHGYLTFSMRQRALNIVRDTLRSQLGASTARLVEIPAFPRTVPGQGGEVIPRLWQARQDIATAIGGRLDELEQSLPDVRAAAQEVGDYLDPQFSNVRTASGALDVADLEDLADLDDEDMLGGTRLRPGAASNNTRRIGRTHNAEESYWATARSAEHAPDRAGIKWNLSITHVEPDECDANARNSSYGCPPGVYRIWEFPIMPNHPNCRCYATVAMLRPHKEEE